MIALKDNHISVYEGNYRPVQAIRNGEKLLGWKTVGMTGNEGEFIGTYNDDLTVYGKTNYKNSRNLCPPPTEKAENNGEVEWGLTMTEQGRFSLFSKTIGTDAVTLETPNVVQTVTLPAGTYTASSNSAVLGLCIGDEMVYSLPYTFTLKIDQTVYFGTYRTDFAETNLYLQIESGESATDYDTYAGDPTKESAPDNIRSLVSSEGEITSSGKNLLQFFENLNNVSRETAQVVKILENGIIIRGNFNPNLNVQSTAWSNGWYFYAENSEILYLSAGDIVTVSADYTLLELHPNRTGNEPIFIHLYGKEASISKQISNALKPVGETMRVSATFIVDKADYYWPVFTLSSNLVKIENLQIEYGMLATPYQPYLPPHTATVPALRGIEVTSATPYNYAETVDGVTHYYISDVLQGERLMRNVGVLVLNGSENWSTYELANDKGFCLYNAVNSVESNAVPCFCNTFLGMSRNQMYHGGLGISVGAAKELRISQCYDDFGRSISQFKAFLAERYVGGNPVIVYYALDNPATEAVQNSPVTFPRYTKVVATPKSGYPDFGLATSVKIQL